MKLLSNKIKQTKEKVKKVNITINIDAEKLDKFKKKCKRLDLYKSRVIDVLLDQFLEISDKEIKGG